MQDKDSFKAEILREIKETLLASSSGSGSVSHKNVQPANAESLPDGRLKCRDCGREYACLVSFKVHLKAACARPVKPVSADWTEDRKLKCKSCARIYSHVSSFRVHLGYCTRPSQRRGPKAKAEQKVAGKRKLEDQGRDERGIKKNKKARHDGGIGNATQKFKQLLRLSEKNSEVLRLLIGRGPNGDSAVRSME